MNEILGRVILAASGSGFPLTQAVIRRFGRGGAVATEAICAGLLVRDLAMVANGAPGRLEPVPARLLYLETAVAAIAAGFSLTAMRPDGLAAARTPGWRVPRAELARRLAVGTLFGLHTVRFRIYLAPGSGRRAETPVPA